MKRLTIIAVFALIVGITASNAVAQANLGIRSVGVGVGVVDPEDVDLTVGFGFYADLGTVHPKVGLESLVGFWQQTEDLGLGGEMLVRDVAFVMRGKYLFNITSPTVKPFAGGGLGFHVVTAGIDVPETNVGGLIIPGYSEDETEIKLGLDIGGGVLFDVSPSVGIQTDVWYSIVSDVSQLALRGVLVFKV